MVEATSGAEAWDRVKSLGVGILFNQELQVREIACMHKGDPRCTMEITFP